MRITAVLGFWIGSLFKQFMNSFEQSGVEVDYLNIPLPKRNLVKKLYLNHIIEIRDYLIKKDISDFNRILYQFVREKNPDILFVMNEAGIQTQTLYKIKITTNCKTAVWIADNPFDSSRFTWLPMNLKYFDFIFVGERTWIPQIEKVAPDSRIIKIISGGGFDKTLFFNDEPESLYDYEDDRTRCQISFTGESYNLKAEGAYRAQVLDYLSGFDLKFWGDSGWEKRFEFHPNLKKCYQGGRLTYPELRKLYKSSCINLNMPAPQIITGFQPRVFEIAACKGFQIVDWREELDEVFSEKELVTFRSIPDLLEKADYFIRNPEKRESYIEKMYIKVWNNYTWERSAKEIIRYLNS